MKKLFSVRTIILACTLLLQLSTLCFHSHGAAGDLDLSFDPGTGVNGPVTAVAVQPDGKVIIGGAFTTANGLMRTGLARLNADGSGDSSFDPGTLLDSLSTDDYFLYAVASVALQPDGKVLLGGSFYLMNGTNVFNGIVRLNANGTLDGSFNPGAAGDFRAVVVQPDGKVLLGGGAFDYGIVRLNANGTLDNSFNPSTGNYASISAIALQPDGRIIISGGSLTGGIARLNANGSADSSFNPGSGPNSTVVSVALQSDGKSLIGGDFTTVNGTNRFGIARLNVNGSLDASFDPANSVTGANGYYSVVSVAVQSDGKAVIGGAFHTVNFTNHTSSARLNYDGSLDSTFNSGPGVEGSVHLIALQPDGKVLIGGFFSKINGEYRNRIARLNADGSLDASFNPGAGVESAVSSIASLPDGKVLIGGSLTFVSVTNQTGRLRLNANGSLDNTFVSDTNFNPGFGVGHDPFPGWDIIYDVAYPTAATVQPNGRVLVGVRTEYWQCAFEGCFPVGTSYSLTRLTADGSWDDSFSPSTGLGGGVVSSVALQPDDKILIGGSFTTVNGTNHNRIARLNTDGSLDSSFNPGTGPNNWIASLALQPDGKVLIGGSFTTVNGTNRNYIARLDANGGLDSSFDPGTGSNNWIESLALQPDGKVLIGGDFTTFNGTNRNRIARLNADGSLDSSFNPGTGADGSVHSIAMQSNGDVLIGGDFTTVNGVLRPYVARLYGDSVAPTLNITHSNGMAIISWPATTLNLQLQETTDPLLPNSWSPVVQTAVTNAGQISVILPTTVGSRFFRLKTP